LKIDYIPEPCLLKNEDLVRQYFACVDRVVMVQHMDKYDRVCRSFPVYDE
jgi:hypothetical protein